MIWRDCPSFPGYAVSEFGDVVRTAPKRGAVVGRKLKPWVREDGYKSFTLRRDEQHVHVKAHQLVAEAFIGAKPFPLAEVCHKDGTRHNDHHSNLRWDTRSGNHADKLIHGTHSRGERHPGSKLTDEQSAEIKRRVASGEFQRVVAADYGIQQGHVSRIINGVRRGA